jgi:serine/threonine-protein kinase
VSERGRPPTRFEPQKPPAEPAFARTTSFAPTSHDLHKALAGREDTRAASRLDGRIAPAGDADRRIGALVGGKFRVDELIGKGGMGQVYRATHLAFGEPVAIKFLKATFAVEPEIRARFRREAIALARLRHPGVVSVHDFGEYDGALYLAMELVDGVPLYERLVVGGVALPMDRIVGIVDQILQVLQVAHARGIVHRDLKADNVMLVRSAAGVDHVKVLDFGLAYMDEGDEIARLTATDAVFGTAAYMSPEQCRGRNVGPPSDVYSTGVILFEMLAGELPFSAPSRAELMAQHMFVEPPAVVQVGVHRAVPAGIEAVARWAMAKSPEARPTPDQMRVALETALRGGDPTARADAAVRERLAVAMSDRSDRALPRPSMSDEATLPRAEPGQVGEGQGPRVVLWGFEGERRIALQSALALQGISASFWEGEERPPSSVDDQSVRAIVVADDGAAAVRTQQVRTDPRVSRVPVVVIDVATPLVTPDLIRAGASDVIVAEAGDSAIAPKIWKLLKRRR